MANNDKKQLSSLNSQVTKFQEIERSSRTRKQPVRFSESVQGKELEIAMKDADIIEEDEWVEDEGFERPSAFEEILEGEKGIIGWIQSKAFKMLGNVVEKIKGSGSTAKWITRLQCIVCLEEFNHKAHLLRHLFTDHCGQSDITIEDIYPTIDAMMELNSLDNYVARRTASREGGSRKRPFVCLLCQKNYRSKSSLIYHEEKEHTHHTYACSKCDRQFKHRLLLVRHQRSHKEARPYSCDMCSLSFKYVSNLAHHRGSHNDRGRYICSFCSSAFTSKRSLEYHIRMHMGYKPYQCDVCQKNFSQKNNLMEHLRIHSGEKPYMCSYCSQTFKTSSQLKTHLWTHSGVKPHTCEICKKSFRHKDSWCTHLRRHTGEKPFSCTHCGKSFLEGTSVRKHERMHTGEKRFACKHCDKPFTDCSNLNRHRKKLHGEGTENNLAQVIYLNLDLPDQELNHLDLGNINDETNTNSIPSLNLALGDGEPDIQVTDNSLQTKTIPIVFNTIDQQSIKEKDLNLTLTDIQNQLDATNQLTVPIVLETLGASEGKGDGTVIPMFSQEGMPLVLKSLEEDGRGKDMPLVLDSSVEHGGDQDSLSLALSNTHSHIQELKELSGLDDSTRQIVTDSQGVPIKITMSDGTQLQVTTTDGESLEVMTSDGVSIPVSLSTPEYFLPENTTLPNIDALTMEGALGELTQLGHDYDIQFVDGHGIKLLPTPTETQNIKLLPSTSEEQSIKLLTSAAETHGIDLLTSDGRTKNIKLLPVSDDSSSSIKLLSSSETSDMKLLASSTGGTSTLSPPSPSQLKWTLHQ